MNSAKAVQTMPSGYTGPGDRVRWKTQLPPTKDPILKPDTVERGVVLSSDAKVIVPTGVGRLLCCDAASGQIRWVFESDAYKSAYSSDWVRAGTPALVLVEQEKEGIGLPINPYAIVFGCGEKVYGLRAQPNNQPPILDWKVTLRGSFEGRENKYYTESCPAVRADGRMYIPVYAANPMQAPGLLLALDRNGREVWRLQLDAYDGDEPRMDNVELSNPAIGQDGTIYVTAHAGSLDNSTYAESGTLYAIRDVSSPQGDYPVVKWRYRPDFDGPEGPGISLAMSSPCVGAGAMVYFGSWDIVRNAQGQVVSQSGTLWAFRDDGQAPSPQWSVSTVNGRALGPVESSPVVMPDGTVFFGTWANGTPYRGAFVKTWGPPGASAFVFESEGAPGAEITNVDATACLAFSPQGTFLAMLITQEGAYAHALDTNGNELWELWKGDRRREINRTDLISVAMGKDGTIYCGTRAYREPLTVGGYVYAMWGLPVSP